MTEQRLINAGHLWMRVKTECNPYGKPTIHLNCGCKVLDMIDSEPTIDFVQVVRCRDCKYYQDNNDGYPHIECRWASHETPDEDDYCSYGEKKDGEQG